VTLDESTVDLQTSESATEEVPYGYVPGPQAEITGLVIEIAPGGETGWHQHPVPSFGMLLQGSLEVTLADGKKKHIEAGEALEVIDISHNGRNVGKVPVKLVVSTSRSPGGMWSRPDSGPSRALRRGSS